MNDSAQERLEKLWPLERRLLNAATHPSDWDIPGLLREAAEGISDTNRDAERYRYLRTEFPRTVLHTAFGVWFEGDGPEQKLDAAIDDAMPESTK